MSKEDRIALLRLDHRILLNVAVTDASGRLVSGLQEKDFTLLDQNKPQAISSFQSVEGSSVTGRAHMVLLIDSLNNSFFEVESQRRAVDTYLRQNNGQLSYPVSLALLSDKGLRTIDSSVDGNLLAKELHERFSRPGRFSFNGGPSGGNQRFLLSIHALTSLAAGERDMPGRAILVWLGQGWPSLTDPGYEAATLEDKKTYFDALVQLATMLRIAQVTVDHISPGGSELLSDGVEQQGFHGIDRFEGAEAQDLSLGAMVQLTGGKVLYKGTDFAGQIRQCALEASAYYRLSFDPETATRPNELRLLSVKLDDPPLIPKTYKLYYAQP